MSHARQSDRGSTDLSVAISNDYGAASQDDFKSTAWADAASDFLLVSFQVIQHHGGAPMLSNSLLGHLVRPFALRATQAFQCHVLPVELLLLYLSLVFLSLFFWTSGTTADT